MAILVHTADIHLRPESEERLDALAEVLSVAEAEEAEVLTIGGDLFDEPENVDQLRSELRTEYFSDLSFEVLLIPGNHDVEAYRGDLLFGDSCTVMANPSAHFSTWTSPDESLRITGIPYQEHPTDELLLALGDRSEFSGDEALLFHGSLDAPIGADTGEESEYRYFPVGEELLEDLGFDYYLAGHYHSAHQLQFEDGSEFAYPGTPASTRTSETDRRVVATLELEDGLGFEPIETFHYLEKEVAVTPGDEDAVRAEIESWVESNVTEYAEASVLVTGVFDEPEDEFGDSLDDAAGPASVTNRALGVDHVLDHAVLQEFRERLDGKEWDEGTKQSVWKRTLRAASEIGSAGELH